MAAPSDSVVVVLAGDVLEELSSLENDVTIILGPGLRRESDKVVATKCGVLRSKESNTYWIDNHQKRYIPVRGECVLGLVTARAGDFFKVDIGSSEQATLSYLAFEGATKRNRPRVQIGDILYARLLVASKDMEPELVCVNKNGKSGGFGVLENGGFMFRTSLNLVRKILSPTCNLSKAFGKHFKHEVAIGMNGRIWVKGHSVKDTIAVSNAYCLAEHMSNEEISLMCQKLADGLAGF